MKCQETRFLEQNRKRARALLLTKVDNFMNKENSVEAQEQAINEKKSVSKERKSEKLRKLKEKWKDNEKLT